MKANKTAYDYGTCHICGEPMREKRIKQDFWIRGKLVVIEDVPAGVCPQCGERVVRAAVGREIAKLIEDTSLRRTARTMKVPLIRFARKVA